MKRIISRGLAVFLSLCLALPLVAPALAAEGQGEALVPQGLDYTEDPVDIPNPDRGFYIPNDGMVVPVSGAGKGEMEVGERPQTVSNVSISTRISHVYFDLRNYSSHAFTATDKNTAFKKDYQAPTDVSIKSRGDAAPWDYDTHFAYWAEHVASQWPHGTSQPITQDGLNYIRARLQEVRDSESVVIVRFNYDGEGFSWVECNHKQDGEIDSLIGDQIEPDKEMLLTHIAQLKPILKEYEDVIMAVDGGFFGPWGEMHSTTFGTSPEAYAWLLDALLDAVPSSRCITVHAGAFLSWYNSKYGTHYTFETIDQIPTPQPGTPEARFGLFNDSYAYGADKGDEDYPDDWGSLSEGAGWEGAPLGEGYDRSKVMTWLRGQNTLYGGEAQGGQTLWNTYPFVAWEAAYAQTVYLNVDYDHNVHKRWAAFSYDNIKNPVTDSKYTQYVTGPYEDLGIHVEPLYDPVYAGKNGLEYWRDRLGYRLVLRDANASACVPQNGVLRFRGAIQNVGFGNIINAKAVTVVLKSKADGSVYRAATEIDPRSWRPSLNSLADNKAAWHELAFSLPLADFDREVPTGEYEIYLKITDPKEQSANKRSIRFANKGTDIWDAELGANRIGATQVTAASAPVSGYAGTLGTLDWQCTLDGELTAAGSSPAGTVYAASYDENGQFLALYELTPGKRVQLEGALDRAGLFWLAEGTLAPQTAKVLLTRHPV